MVADNCSIGHIMGMDEKRKLRGLNHTSKINMLGL